MIKLNTKATKVFLDFLVRMQGLDELDLPLEGHATLRLKKGEDVETNDGTGQLLSIGTLSGAKPNSYEYCMVFILIDKRKTSGWRMDIAVYPTATIDDANNVQEDCVLFENRRIKTVITNFQRAHATKAYHWLLELKTAGYLRKRRKQ